jgi:hypothetical protein
VSYGSEPHLSAEVGSGAATCPMAPDLATRLRWAPVLLACVARHTCFQRMSAHFQGASRQGHHAHGRHAGRQRSQYLQGVRTDIYSVVTV